MADRLRDALVVGRPDHIHGRGRDPAPDHHDGKLTAQRIEPSRGIIGAEQDERLTPEVEQDLDGPAGVPAGRHRAEQQVEKLGDLVYHAAAKDTRINEQYCRVYGVLDDRFERAGQNPVNIGGRNTLNRWPAHASWQFVAVGRGHDQDFWVRFLQALYAVDPGMAVNIEHEDAELGQLEGLREAAGNLTAAAAAAGLPVT